MQDLSDGQFVRWATGMSVPTARDVGNRQDSSRRGIMADKAPIKIVGDQLVMGPVTVGFQRTLRIPNGSALPAARSGTVPVAAGGGLSRHRASQWLRPRWGDAADLSA